MDWSRTRSKAGEDHKTVTALGLDSLAMFRKVLSLKGCRPKPVRRVYIPKADRPKTNGKRPLGGPPVLDRVMQALVKLTLEPEWEPRFEANSYGFRPGRCTMDAIEVLHRTLSMPGSRGMVQLLPLRGGQPLQAGVITGHGKGLRRGPGASISEAAWSPIERARSVTAEGSSMSPLPRVPAGRFRRSGTRDTVEAAERLAGDLWCSGSPGRRSDGGGAASEGSGVKAGEAPGSAGNGLDARAFRCAMGIIGSTPTYELLRPQRRRADLAPAASGSQCRPATSDA